MCRLGHGTGRWREAERTSKCTKSSPGARKPWGGRWPAGAVRTVVSHSSHATWPQLGEKAGAGEGTEPWGDREGERGTSATEPG